MERVILLDKKSGRFDLDLSGFFLLLWWLINFEFDQSCALVASTLLLILDHLVDFQLNLLVVLDLDRLWHHLQVELLDINFGLGSSVSED